MASRLRLSALRAAAPVPPGSAASGSPSGDGASGAPRASWLNPDVTRRQVLGAFGTAAALPLLLDGTARALGRVSVSATPDGLMVRLGETAYVLDAAHYEGTGRGTAGRPRLSVETLAGVVTARLAHARFPGTAVAADVTVRLTPRRGAWQIRVERADGTAVEGGVAAWLAGAARLETAVRAEADLTARGAAVRVRVSGPADLAYGPDGSWTYTTAGRVSATLPEGSVQAGLVRVGLAGAESLFARPVARRSAVTLGDIRATDLRVQPGAGDRWRLASASGAPAASRLTVEAGRAARGALREALRIDGDDAAGWTVEPAPGFAQSGLAADVGRAGAAFALGLRTVRYAAVYGDASDAAAGERVVEARFAPETRLASPTAAALFGDADDAVFRLRSAGARLVEAICRPFLKAAALLPGGSDTIAWPADGGAGTLVDVASGRARRRPGGLPVVGLDARRGARFALDGFSVALVRPRDLAVFVFGLDGLDVLGLGPSARLVANGAAKLTVLLAPQTFGEQAFFQTATSGVTPKPMEGAAAEPGGSETPRSPAQGRIAGPSRLVFRVPSGTEIPYSLEGLLAAMRGLDLAVAPNARTPVSSVAAGASAQIDNGLLAGLGLGQTPFGVAAGAGGAGGVAVQTPLGTRFGEAGIAIQNGVATRVARTGVAAPLVGRSGGGGRRGPVVVAGVFDPAAAAQVVQASASIANVRAARYGLASEVGAFITEIGAGAVFAVPPAPRPPGVPEAPRADETAIEAPFRLIVSPDQYAGFVHLTEPGASDETRAVELWHTRLVRRRAADPGNLAHVDPRTCPLTALWYSDPEFGAAKANPLPLPVAANAPFRTSINARQRHQIVHLTANHETQSQSYTVGPTSIRAGGTGRPATPAQARRLHLSAMGADLDARGAWDPLPQGFALSEWVHRATVGRDQFVRIVEEGWLFPTGHRAALVTVTERKISDSGLAYLAQRMFVVVREPVVLAATGSAVRDRESPFTRLELVTRVTPDLDNPSATDEAGQLQSLFWPAVGGQDVRFVVRAEDVEGTTHTVSMPLAFVEAGQITAGGTHRSAALNTLFQGYNVIVVNPGQLSTGDYSARQTLAMKGAGVAFARARTPGDTTLAAAEIVLGATDRATAPFFAPKMLAAKATVPALATVSETGPVILKYNAAYLTKGLRSASVAPPSLDAAPTGDNPAELFLDVFTTEASSVPAEKSGGFVQIGLKPTALSRTQGPVAGPVAGPGAGSGTFNPEAFFGDSLTRLFGVIKLTDVLGLGQSIARAPKMITDALAAGERILEAAGAFSEYANGAAGEVGALADGSMAGQHIAALGDALDGAEASASAVYAAVQAAFSAKSLADVGALDGAMTGLRTNLQAVLDALGTPGVISRLPGATRNALDTAARTLHGLVATAETVTKTLDSVARVVQGIQDAAEQRVRIEWSPTIRNWPDTASPIFDARQGESPKGALTVAAVFEAKQGGGGPGYTVSASLDRFAVNLPGPVARLDFDRLAFRAVSGRKAEVDVKFGGITFLGPLSFIEKIKDVIPLDGFSDPPYVDVSASGIVAGYTLELPDVAVGAFSLTNIRLAAELQIPFLGETALAFSIGRKEEPVNVIVLFLGGGAYFGVTFGMKGLVQVEAAIEAGAALALNFGVAAGEVHAFVGIYFKLQLVGGEKLVELTAYFRVGGSVKVLGILTVSIELRLEMSYTTGGGNDGKLVGRAELKVKIEIFFLSKTIKIQYERKLAGSNNDPTAYDALAQPYADPLSLAPAQTTGWTQYLLAFA